MISSYSVVVRDFSWFYLLQFYAVQLFCGIYLGPSEAPLSLSLQPLDAFTLSMTWDPPSPEHKNGIILRYYFNITLPSTSDTDGSLTPNTYTIITSLHPYYIYKCSVAAETSVGRGPYRSDVIQMPEAGSLMISLYANKIGKGLLNSAQLMILLCSYKMVHFIMVM